MTSPMSNWIAKLKNWMTPRKAIFIIAGLLVVVFVTRGLWRSGPESRGSPIDCHSRL